MGVLIRSAIPSTACVLALFTACVPTVDAPLSVLTAAPRVLAVQSQPAEAAPGDPVQLTVLYANSNGALDTAALTTAFCTARRALSENGPVNPVCYDPSASQLVAPVAIPMDACRLFGPTPPPPEPGMPAGRPVDPDITGGYYQPIHVSDSSATSIAFTRIACGIAGATQEQTVAYNRSYRRNQNPAVPSLFIVRNDSETPVNELQLEPNQSVTVRVRWPETESYVVFDPIKREVVTTSESMRVSVYASAGAWQYERTGRAASDPTPYTDNAFTAPGEPGPVQLIWVLRDDRGGVSWRVLRATVQ